MAVADRWASKGFAALALAAMAPTCPAMLPTVTLREVAGSGLSSPVEFVHSGDGSGRMFIVQQTGQIKVFLGGAVLSPDFLTVPNTNGGERGLLGLAFHPNYASNRAFYTFHTCLAGGILPCPSNGAVTVTRFLRDAVNPNRADPASAAVILQIPHPDGNHNGGRMAFGADGYLYIGIGDGGQGGDILRNGQNRCVLLGKILRIAVDGGAGYTIPPDNPYAGSSCEAGTCPEIWAYGLRNPWKFSFDRLTDDLIIADVGQSQREEVNFEPAAWAGGNNYGWGVYEGNNCFNNSYGISPNYPASCYAYPFTGTPGACAMLADHARPVLWYAHTEGYSITGGYRYRGSNPALKGFYFYGDYGYPHVWAARPDRFGAWTTGIVIPDAAGLSSISSFGEDPAGEIYVVDHLAGKIYALDGPPLLSVASRKTHGGAGDFDLAIDTSRGTGDYVTTEPRAGAAGGTSHLVVFNFSVPIMAPGTPTAVDAAGVAVGTPSATFSGTEVRVTLDNIPENQRVQVSLENVNGAGINVTASLGFLVGDMDGSGAVTASDILRVKGRLGQAAGATTFGYDADLSSDISAFDVEVVKARAGLAL